MKSSSSDGSEFICQWELLAVTALPSGTQASFLCLNVISAIHLQSSGVDFNVIVAAHFGPLRQSSNP